MTKIAISRPAAIALLVREGVSREAAAERVDKARVAARFNDGFGRVPYYYPKDLYDLR